MHDVGGREITLYLLGGFLPEKAARMYSGRTRLGAKILRAYYLALGSLFTS